MIATVVIPCGPEHWATGVYQEAINSVQAQTIPTDYILIQDAEKRGAAWARNKGTSQVNTPFVVWLDADDSLAPEFVESTVKAYQRGAFVYTDWTLHGKTIITPEWLDPLGIGQQHVITTLMPLAAWQTANGFDESLDSLEDEDFYRRIACYGWRGVKADGALVDYRRHRGFSLVNQEAVDVDIVKARIEEKTNLFKKRYRKFETMYMYTSGKVKEPTGKPVVGIRQPNDVLCEANYVPQTQAGPITRRKYIRAGFNEPIWVDHDDALARPDLWRIIALNPDAISPDVERVKELYERALAKKKLAEQVIIPESPIEAPVTEAIGFAAMSLDELRQEFAKRGLNEADLTGGVSIHWKLLRKTMISYLEGLEHEKPNPRTPATVENS